MNLPPNPYELNVDPYVAQDYGEEEQQMYNLFILQHSDAREYFLNVIKPRLDRSYKLYIAYTGDRQKEIKKWQSNIFVPYIHAAVETLMPRVLDARPEFIARGRSQNDQNKTPKQQQLMDFYWERAGMDKTNEDLVRSSLVFGTGYMQVSWKKDVRKLKFLKTKDIRSKKLQWEEKEKVFYDAPYAEWVDNYNLMYDWHNSARESKQFWIKRLVLTEAEIRRRYPMADKKRLLQAFATGGGDLQDYAAIRQDVKITSSKITKQGSAVLNTVYTGSHGKYTNTNTRMLRMFEVFEWWRPFEDTYSVHVGGGKVPILKGGFIPIPYDFKEAPFIEVPYLRLPGEYEGYGLPIILENPQIMLNLIKNQRLDAATLSIHKMWIVNPLANINKDELVTRPFGIIYSIDPNGVREVQFSDIKPSAYKEEELLKSDLRYSSGVDDFSMGVGGSAGSATEVRHLRESTLERVRLFVNHLGEGYSVLMRYWMDMQRQFMTDKMQIRITGEDGNIEFPIIEKDDLMGFFDYKAAVLPSIAGQQDVKKKQDMDLFQLLINMPFVDPKKLVGKILEDFNWTLDSVSAEEAPPQPGMDPSMDPAMAAMMGGMPPAGGPPTPGGQSPTAAMAAMGPTTGAIDSSALGAAMGLLRGGAQAQPPSGFAQAASPIDLLAAGGRPPTVAGIQGKGTTNPRGLNMGGKVNTNIPTKGLNANPGAHIAQQASNIQR